MGGARIVSAGRDPGDARRSERERRRACARPSSATRAPTGLSSPLSHYRKRLARRLLQLGTAGEARQALEAIRAERRDGRRLTLKSEWLLSRAWLQEGNLKEAGAALELAGSYRAENPLVPEPSPYAGGASCVSCHRELSRSHEKSRHARTFHHGRGLAGSAVSRAAAGRPGRPQGYAQLQARERQDQG